MTILKVILLVFIFTASLFGNIIIKEDSINHDILSKATIYKDKSKKLTINDIKKGNIKFTKNYENTLSLGYTPEYNLWIKFTLENNSNRKKEYFIEYDNALTTNVKFFNPELNYKVINEGLFSKVENRKTINPTFKIQLQPQQTNTYYLNVSSEITTLIVNLKIWNIQKFYEKEIIHQLILASFFAAMFVLFVYNLSIYFFTKDLSYLYYCLYLFVMVFHQSLFVGIANLYLLNKEVLIFIFEIAPLIVVLPIFTLALFTKYFLKLEQYPIHNKILKALIILIPINVIVLLSIDELAIYRNHITIIVLSFLMYVTGYALYKKNKQAKYIFIGWLIFFFSGFLMILTSIGYINIYKYIPYLPEIAILTESIILSVALSNRIKILQEEKDSVVKELFIQKENEKERLANEVKNKTWDLNNALEERDLLLRELNHRVKNNMQTIVSLIRLQNDKIDNEMLNDILITIQNRIRAMSYLHELLYTQDDMTFVNTKHYFQLICEEMQTSYNRDIKINIEVNAELKVDMAIYCGLVLNELITNIYKYAFPNEKKGEAFISLNKNENIYELIVYDTGIGYEGESNSLGLKIVESLINRQLKGDMKAITENGAKYVMTWKVE